MQLRNQPATVDYDESTGSIVMTFFDAGYSTSADAMAYTPTKVVTVTLPATIADVPIATA